MPVTIDEMPPETPCSLCARPLGAPPAFVLHTEELTARLHAHCFSAWTDVAETAEPDDGGSSRRAW